MSRYGYVSCHYCPSRRGIQVVSDKKGEVGVRFACKKHRAIAHEELQAMIQNDKGI